MLKFLSWAIRGLAKVYAGLVKDDPAPQPGSKANVVESVAIGQHDSEELKSLFWVAPATIAQSECDELLAMKCSPRAIRLLEPGDWVDFALVAPAVAYRPMGDAGITSKDDQAIILHYSQQKVLAVEGRGSCNLGKGGEPQPEEIKRNRASGPEDSEKAMDAWGMNEAIENANRAVDEALQGLESYKGVEQSDGVVYCLQAHGAGGAYCPRAIGVGGAYCPRAHGVGGGACCPRAIGVGGAYCPRAIGVGRAYCPVQSEVAEGTAPEQSELAEGIAPGREELAELTAHMVRGRHQTAYDDSKDATTDLAVGTRYGVGGNSTTGPGPPGNNCLRGGPSPVPPWRNHLLDVGGNSTTGPGPPGSNHLLVGLSPGPPWSNRSLDVPGPGPPRCNHLLDVPGLGPPWRNHLRKVTGPGPQGYDYMPDANGPGPAWHGFLAGTSACAVVVGATRHRVGVNDVTGPGPPWSNCGIGLTGPGPPWYDYSLDANVRESLRDDDKTSLDASGRGSIWYDDDVTWRSVAAKDTSGGPA